MDTLEGMHMIQNQPTELAASPFINCASTNARWLKNSKSHGCLDGGRRALCQSFVASPSCHRGMLEIAPRKTSKVKNP